MSILKHLTLRMLKLNKKRTLVTIVGIILSAAMITGVSSITASFQDYFMQRAIETDGNYHASFYDVETDNIRYIADNPFAKETMLSRNRGFAAFDEATNELKPYLFIKEYDAVAMEHMPIHLAEGRFPQSHGEMVITEDVQAIGGSRYDIGQSVTLEIGDRVDQGIVLTGEWFQETETLQTQATATYTITGIISRPDFESGSSPGYTVVTYLDAEKLQSSERINVSILGQNPRNIFEKVPEIADNAEVESYSYNNNLLREMGVSQNNNLDNFLYSITLIIILLISVGSITVIYNAFAISVSERKKQFGMLASVGATPGQIRRSVFFEGLILGGIGIPIGILSGLGGIGVTLGIVNRLLIEPMFMGNAVLRLVVSPAVILITIFFVATIIFLSAFIPAKLAARISPIDAIRLNTDINIKGKALKTSRLSRYLFGIEGELALKNLKRNRKRYRATVFSLVISIILFVTISSFMQYGFVSTNMYYGELPYNVTVRDHRNADVQQAFYNQVAAMEGVERYSVVRTIWAVADNLDRSQFSSYAQENLIEFLVNEGGNYYYDFNILALGEKEFAAYVAEIGVESAKLQDTENPRGILLNKGVANDGRVQEIELLSLRSGDKVSLADGYSFWDSNEAKMKIEIGAVTDIRPFGINNLGVSMVNLIVADEVFDKLLESVPEESPVSGQLFIQAEDSAGLVDGINELARQSGNNSLAVSDISAQQEELNNTRTVFAIFLYGFLTLITLIGVTNIFNTISTNVALRRREFAMLKSVGLTPKGFNRMINYESIFYGLKALMYGLPISIAISVLIYNSFSNMFGFAFVLPWREIAYCIIGVFIIVFLTMMHASLKLKSENIIDALKAE
ncbi:ABC transporter permease [Dethiobacter alkaliphilus]|uniref:ABC3 transporter permease protein domain-containing protein n=1 Tax=Dethiobacter alkaliphilus AHT 1 TaxID=555088 RepID=C0GKV7_DETAL|nr:ABC transporter permease [Dethiobacter alkaliphilus]EEG76039.1 protein of unknown function DUF214 [Dethiobacter alkaliphilus AHT 1]